MNGEVEDNAVISDLFTTGGGINVTSGTYKIYKKKDIK
jgi:hypothetical protein